MCVEKDEKLQQHIAEVEKVPLRGHFRLRHVVVHARLTHEEAKTGADRRRKGAKVLVDGAKGDVRATGKRTGLPKEQHKV